MPKVKDTVRKNFMMKADLEPRLMEYCERYGFSQAQTLNLAIRTFFENEDMKRFISRVDPQELVQGIMSEYLKMNPVIDEKGDDET